MKKFITLMLILVMVAALAVPTFAATGLNANEQAVIDKLHEYKVMGENEWKFYIPDKYVTSAKNYFIGDCDMTEKERDIIIGYIEEGAQIVKKEADAVNFDGTVYNLATMTQASRSAVLLLGQKACAEVDLNLVYNNAENKVIITRMDNGAVMFENTPLVKVTGQENPVTAATVGIAVALVLVAGTAAMLVASKRKGLLVK